MSDDAVTELDFSQDASAPLAQDTTVAVSEPKSTVEDAITKAFADVEARTSGQPRDEVGRFAAKQANDAVKAVSDPNQPVAPVVDPAAQPAAQMPSSWGKAQFEVWAKLPPEAQQMIATREAQIAAGFRRYEGLAEYAQIAEQNGGTLRTVLENVRAWEDGMGRDPIATLVHAAQSFRVDPATLIAALQGAPQPVRQPVPQQIDIDRIVDQRLTQRETSRSVEAFFGDSANKYAEQVAPLMAAALRAEPSLSLKDAYDRACWADPQVRAELLAAQAAEKAAKQVNEAQRTTQRALQASKSLSPSAGSAPLNGATKGKSIEAVASAAWDQHVS
jgi:hypothetical protein